MDGVTAGPPIDGVTAGPPMDGVTAGPPMDVKLGYKNTTYDPKFFYKWIDGMPILVIFHSDDFRWCGPTHLLAE